MKTLRSLMVVLAVIGFSAPLFADGLSEMISYEKSPACEAANSTSGKVSTLEVGKGPSQEKEKPAVEIQEEETK